MRVSDIIEEFIEKMEKLQGIGVDVSKIASEDTILKLVQKTFVNQDEEEIIKKIKELKEIISNPLSTMNMNDLVQKSAESAMSKIAEKQFQEQGFQGYEA